MINAPPSSLIIARVQRLRSVVSWLQWQTVVSNDFFSHVPSVDGVFREWNWFNRQRHSHSGNWNLGWHVRCSFADPILSLLRVWQRMLLARFTPKRLMTLLFSWKPSTHVGPIVTFPINQDEKCLFGATFSLLKNAFSAKLERKGDYFWGIVSVALFQ